MTYYLSCITCQIVLTLCVTLTVIHHSKKQNKANEGGSIFKITDPEQTRPREWQNALKSASFMTALFRFLANSRLVTAM